MKSVREIIDEMMPTLLKPTEAQKWLANLPVFKCPYCGKDTIFREGCGCEIPEESSDVKHG